MKAPAHWIATTDEHGAVLYRCERTQGSAVHIEHIAALMRPPEHQNRGRPSMLSSAAHGNAHSAAPNHATDEHLHAFAREVAEWISENARRLDIPRVCAFAPPKLLGELRGCVKTSDRLELVPGELAHLKPGELAVHPAILAAVTGR